MPDPADYRLDPCSITYQLAACGLLPAGAGAVIDLSNSEPEPAPVTNGSGPPKLVNWRRSKYPMLMAWPSADGRTLQAWCPPCGKLHTHGRHGADQDCGPACPCPMHGGGHNSLRSPCLCPPGSGDGHRGAHCASLSRSPMKATGYVIREVRP
jgi:hypothetical protein